MGNSGCGLLLNQIRKSGCGFSTWSCSTSLSNCGIQLKDRWQFAKNTQFPSRTPSLIILVAIGAWPWPSDKAWNLLFMPHDSANCNKALVGSYDIYCVTFMYIETLLPHYKLWTVLQNGQLIFDFRDLHKSRANGGGNVSEQRGQNCRLFSIKLLTIIILPVDFDSVSKQTFDYFIFEIAQKGYQMIFLEITIKTVANHKKSNY